MAFTVSIQGAKRSVAIGPSSILGWLTFIGAEVTAFAGANPAGLSPHTLAVLGVIALVATNAGRQLQAAVAPPTPPAPPKPPAG